MTSTAVMASSSSSSSYAPIAAAYATDFESITASVLHYLPIAHQLHDSDRVNYYLRRLLGLLDQRHELTPEQRTRLLTILLVLLPDTVELHVQLRVIQVMTHLLRQHSDPPLLGLSLPWRPLYDLLASLHFNSARTFTYPQSLLKQHSSQLVKLVHHARRYFPADTATQLWQLLSPHLTPFDNASTRCFSLLALFTPTHLPNHAPALVSILPSLLQYEQWYDHSPTALLPFYSLYARLSKHQVGVVSLLPHLPLLLNGYLQLLELDVGREQSANAVRTVSAYAWLNEKSGNAMEEISRCLATILVYHLHVQQTNERTALSLLAQFMHTVATYFHPSNQGKWTTPLASLLSQLGVQYAKRRGRELHGQAKYDKAHYLKPAAEDNNFVSVLLPIALQALFSKSHTMVGAAEDWLKHTAYFHPSLVLPALTEHIYPALDDLSSPHRMLSVMQAMSQLAPILFNRHYYPQGASHLDALLWQCLPGVDAIDAMKTSLTLTWFTMVFYHIPLIDARQTEGLSKSRVDRADEPKPRVIERITSRFKAVSESGGVEREEEQVMAMDEMEDEDLSEMDAKSATFRFDDWCLAFMDAIFKVLSSADRYAKKDFLDVHTARLLGKVMRAFFACQSNDIFLACATKLCKRVLSQQHTNAAKQYGIIVAMATLTHPEVMLSKLFEPLYQRLVQTKGGETKLAPLAKSELEWATYLLSQCVKQAAGGPGKHYLLPYKTKVVTAFRLISQNDERSVRKVAGKLIRNYIAALSSVYPNEWRPFDNRVWSETERWRHWNAWCSWEPEQEREESVIDPRIEWHIPSPEEMTVVDELVNGHIDQPLTVLSGWIEGKELEVKSADVKEEKKEGAGKGDGPIERALAQLINVVRGAQAVLGDMQGKRSRQGEEGDAADEQEEADTVDAEAAFTGARCPLVSIKRSRPLRPVKSTSALLGSSSSLRFALLPFLQRLSTRLLTDAGNASIKSLTLYIKLAHFVLTMYGVNENKLQAEQYMAGYTRKWMREYRSGWRVSKVRPLLVQRAYHYHLSRLADASKGQVFSDEVRGVIGALQRLSVNDFAKVRQKAQKALCTSIFHYPQSIDYTLHSLTATLSSADSNAEQISGALSVLADPTVIALTQRRWGRLAGVVEALTRGVAVKEDRVEVLLQTYFTALFPALYPLPVYVDQVKPSEASLVDEEKVRRRNTAISRFSETNEKRYRSLVTSLLSRAQDNSLHWRYQLMATAFLFVLLKPSALVTPPSSTSLSSLYDEVVAFFASTLYSELAPMRDVANEALSNVLGMHFIATRQHRNQLAGQVRPTDTATTSAASPSASVTKSGVMLDMAVVESESDWLSTVFYDYLYSGWQDEANPVVTYYSKLPNSDDYALHRTPSPFQTSIPASLHPTPTALSSAAISQLSSTITSHLPALIDSLVHHHPTLEAKIEGGSASSQSGAGDTIANLACSHFQSVLWPFTRVAVTSKAFDFTHVALIRGLVETLPGLLLAAGGPLEAQVKRLMDKTEQDAQCTCAEIVAGIIKGSMHLTFAQQRQVQSWLLPLTLSALSAAQPDAVPHWTAAMRYITSNTDPRRLSWLTRPLLSAAFGSLPGSGDRVDIEVTSPLMQYKRFHFLIPLLIERGYRASALSVWLLERMTADRWLYSSYKQVRSEVGWLVFLAIENQFKIKATGTAGQMELLASDGLRRYVADVVRVLESHSGVLYRGSGGEEKKEDVDVGMTDEDEESAKTSVTQQPKADSTDEKTDEAAQQAKLYLETVLTSMLLSLLAGSMIAMSPVYQALLPHIIQSQHVADVECAALGKQVAKVAAWVSLKGNVTEVRSGEVHINRQFDTSGVIANVLSEVSELLSATSHASWHVKVSAVRYLQVVIPRHSLLMTAQHVNDVEQTVMAALQSPQIEVREAAQLTLTSLLSACLSHPASSVIGFSSSAHASSHVLRLLKSLNAVAAKSYRGKDKKVDPALLARRHGAVLGLLALIACHPYDLPSHLPALLAQLAVHVNDPQPVSGAVRKAVGEFLRTHKEEWESHFKDKFTEEQLDALTSVQSAPTYFA